MLIMVFRLLEFNWFYIKLTIGKKFSIIKNSHGSKIKIHTVLQQGGYMITISEFEAAMEQVGATRLGDVRYCGDAQPCYKAVDIRFLHSGTYQVIILDKIPVNILGNAIAEIGTEHFSKTTIVEITSVKGLITLVAMLKECYSKEFVNQLINETYQKLFDYAIVARTRSNLVVQMFNPKMQELCKLIKQFDSLVNPFANYNIRTKIKKYSEYMDKVNARFLGDETQTDLSLETESINTQFKCSFTEWEYWAIKDNRKNGSHTIINHYCFTQKIIDEVISVEDIPGIKSFEENFSGGNLSISIISGLAWENDRKASPVQDYQIKKMINYLQDIVRNIKEEIIDNMTI